MRILRHLRFLSFLTLCVALLFGIRELPELMSLADDVSNDGEVMEFVAPDVSSVNASVSHVGESPAHATRSRVVARPWMCLCRRTLPHHSGKSLLQLLSLLRV